MAWPVLVPVVMASVVAVAGDFEAGEENGRDDEQDSGDDHNPRREPVEPIGFNGLGWLASWRPWSAWLGFQVFHSCLK